MDKYFVVTFNIRSAEDNNIGGFEEGDDTYPSSTVLREMFIVSGAGTIEDALTAIAAGAGKTDSITVDPIRDSTIATEDPEAFIAEWSSEGGFTKFEGENNLLHLNNVVIWKVDNE